MGRRDTYFGDCKSPYSRPADCKSAGTGEAYFKDGTRYSHFSWTTSGKVHEAEVLNEYVGGNEFSCGAVSYCPMWMYENPNFRITAGFFNSLGLYTSVEAALSYNEVLGFWRGKNGQFHSMHFNGNAFTGGKLNYAQALSNKFKAAGSIIGLLGTGISVYQAVTATSTDACLEYSIDAIIGAAGAFCPELFGLPATLWFFGGKQVTYCYGSNVITPMIQNGINPGLMIYQPFK